MAKLHNKMGKRQNSVEAVAVNSVDEVQLLGNLKEQMKSQVQDEQYVEAMDTMAEIAKHKKLDVEIMCMGAKCYLMTGDNDRAVKWINNILSYAPENIQARIMLARICLLEDRTEDAFAIFDTILENMREKLVKEDEDEIRSELEYYTYTDEELIVENYPSIAKFMGLSNTEISVEDNDSAVKQQSVQNPIIEEETAGAEDSATQRAREAVARLRALLSKHRQEQQEVTEDVSTQALTPEPVPQSASPVEEFEETMLEEVPENVQENNEMSTGFDVDGVTIQIMEKPVSLREKIKLFNTFAAGCYVNEDYQSAFELLSTALQLDSEEITVIKNLAYVCAAAGEAEQAMEFASKLPMIDFAVLKNIK